MCARDWHGPTAFRFRGKMTLTSAQSRPQKVFIVHGHDTVRDSVVRWIETIGLEVIVLDEQASRGQTIIEKFEENVKDVGFAIVLLTPDDEGWKVGGKKKPRARQNVIFELGFFVGRLTRSRVCALRLGDVEIPSDFQGVLYIDSDKQGGWKLLIAQELAAAQLKVDASKAFRMPGLPIRATEEPVTTARTSSAPKSDPVLHDPSLAVLSDVQAQTLLGRLAPKSRDVIALIASAPVDGMKLTEVATHFGVRPSDLIGVWAGLTRVTRRVTQQNGAALIDWRRLGWEEDWTARLHPTTRDSFRRSLGLN